MARTARKTCIGISGWTYGPWRGTFYPNKLKQREELAYASRQLNSIEINGTFYSLQKPKSFATWYEQTPDDFVFSVKGPKFITHIRRLKGVDSAVANFFASGILQLEAKLGPILWQLPPNFPFDADKISAFFELLPRDTIAAATMAKNHDAFMTDRTWMDVKTSRPLRYSMEVRHESFRTPAFIEMLRKHHIALVIAETAGKWPFMEDVTADFLYLRLHGDEQLYVSGYTDEALDRWAAKIEVWRNGGEPETSARVVDSSPPKRKGRDVFVYFDNDVKVRSPVDAKGLAKRLGISRGEELRIAAVGSDEEARRVWPAARKTKR
jgi:uncharacterized protein YecE (DUF72 family)